MTTSLLALPLSSPIPGPVKKRRVLLVDASAAKRELRAAAMRQLGMDVDCACDIVEARCWWRADLYDLVVMNVQNERGHRDKFCDDIRGATPPQQLAFLVGKPEYLAMAPGAEEALMENAEDQASGQKTLPPCENVSPEPQRWGIMEASRRISTVRSLSAARSAALRNRPTPPRDLEVRRSNRDEAEFQFSQLQKEEIL
jgi:CheY-like chemotaxis protein